MKAQVANFQFRTFCLRIVPKWGQTIRLVQYPTDLKMTNGQVYQSAVGYQFTGYQSTTNFSPSLVDLEGIAGFAGIGKDQIASGMFDNARCYLFATEWNNPVEDLEPIASSILGKTTLMDEKYRIEEMSLIDALNQNIGDTYTPICQKIFGSQGFAECKKVPTVVTGTLTAVASQFSVTDTARTELIASTETLVPTDITKASPARVTVKNMLNLKDGDLVSIPANGTGFTELDGQTWTVGTLNTATKKFDLVGTNTIATTGLLKTSPRIIHNFNAGMFTEGLLQFTSGANAGLKPMEVRAHLGGGVIVTHEPFYYLPVVGDAYTLTEGCMKRLQDCKDKGNVLNFGGFPHIPTSSDYLQRGTKW